MAAESRSCVRTTRAPLWFAVAAFALFFAFAPKASAYSWMIRHGYTGCATCHVDPSGGSLLNLYGRAQGDLLLRMRYGAPTTEAHPVATDLSFDDDDDDEAKPKKPKAEAPKAKAAEPEAPRTGFLWGLADLPEWLLLSGSLRGAYTVKPSISDSFRVFPMQADLTAGLHFGIFRAAGSLGLARVKSGTFTRAAQLTTGQGDQLNAISRVHWLGLEFEQGRYMVRAGRMNLPFGLRIPEHTTWVRESTATNIEADQQHGVAFAYNDTLVRAELMAIAGNYQVNPDRYRERGYAGYAEFFPVSWASIGVSSLLTSASADLRENVADNTLRQAHGAFTRVSPIKPLVLMAEADVLLKSRHGAGYAGLLQADYEIIQGLHVMGTGEIVDNGKLTDGEASPGAGQPRVGGWLTLDWFFFTQLELRVDGIVRQNDPFTLFGQLHFYL